MPLSEDKKNEVKEKVLYELEHMFTEMSNKYNTKENQEMMLFLLDIEQALKQALVTDESISAATS
ncbi:MAG TPA: hypothetical protein PKY82_04345 [Pyrinomonadaceae bacterium]|nr:hypothetical protein [Pyrinomonadaceae bacterium]